MQRIKKIFNSGGKEAPEYKNKTQKEFDSIVKKKVSLNINIKEFINLFKK